MSKRRRPPEPEPPDMLAREHARLSAAAIRRALADPASAGEKGVIHVDLHRPRRGLWLRTWANLPGLMLDLGSRTYTHSLLPGWSYTVAEMQTEMLDDLDLFAATGEQPKGATRR